MAELSIQPGGFLLELSPDWLILRASENVHRFLGEYHSRLIGEPLSAFTMAQPLHDLRNALARQRSATGIARAYRVRLIDEPRWFDIAFQLADGRIILEGVPSPEDGFGAAMGSLSRLIDGLDGDGQGRLDNAARRMRALTGFDRVRLSLGDSSAESSRGTFAPVTLTEDPADLPAIIADTADSPVALFPRAEGKSLRGALLRSPAPGQIGELRAQGIRSVLNVPLIRDGAAAGCFRCDSRAPMQPTLEMHAAAELFAQVFAMRLEMERG